MNTYRLQPGDEVRVIAPSDSWRKHRTQAYQRAKLRLEELGLRVTYGAHLKNQSRFGTGLAAERLADLHDAYRDPNVRLVIALHGGWSANTLLRGIDWELIRANPKPLMGYSDTTVLINALYAQTGMVNYLGPTFSTLGSRHLQDYTFDNFRAVVMGEAPLMLQRSREWQRARRAPLSKTRPWQVLQEGQGEGTIIGGNMGTFYLLQGTPYQPMFDHPFILVAEDDDEPGRYSAREFDRRLESLLQLPGVREHIRGLVIGRFQPSSLVTMPDVRHIVSKMGLRGIPVIADVDFGHTTPLLTLPIGGRALVSAQKNQASLNLLQW
ncbi:MAG TPA: S66 peptidase family protein [Candidatus Saccharimonadia bacterium]|nr:S66 peptidase family protein [Candidatus Saccharimonadia bacterium]